SCDGAVSVALTEVVSDSTSPFYFTLTRTWTASDTCGNIVSDSMVIEVNDTLYPAGSGMTHVSDPDNVIKYLKVSPNPLVNFTNVEFSLYKDEYVIMELYNHTGVKLETIYNGNVAAGSSISLALTPDASLGTGMYLLVLRTNHDIKTRRIILKR
ncbi:MAG: T9SS type A sorting domain-containing protein, partial [Bacteroidota bacterium]